MLTLPDAIVPMLLPFATPFHCRTWEKAQVLLVGAVLTPGQRTVAAALRVMGLSGDRNYARYHHVLNRAAWSPLEASQVLLRLLLRHLDRGDGPLVFGIDETLERRQGPQISALGVYRDAMRSSRSYTVKASGLRWISLMWLGHISWAGRYWALPFLTVLAPSERYYRKLGRRHKKLTDWARQMILLLRRWLPHRPLVLVGDNGYAVLDLLHFCQSLCEPVTLIARLRLDAGLYDLAPPRRAGQTGRPRVKGPRQPTLKQRLDDPSLQWDTASVSWYDGTIRTMELASGTAVWYHHGKPPVPIRWVLVRDPKGELDTQALLCTGQAVNPAQILEWFVLRWSASGGEVTYQEVRAHLGVETQRQWSDRAIARTTPVLMGLFSWVALATHSLHQDQPIIQRRAAWYAKPAPTFVDAIALVRRHLWLESDSFSTSPPGDDREKTFLHSIPASLIPSPTPLERTKSSLVHSMALSMESSTLAVARCS